MPTCQKCAKKASFNIDGESIPIVCKQHKEDGMINMTKIAYDENTLDAMVKQYEATVTKKYDVLTLNTEIEFMCKCGEIETKIFKKMADRSTKYGMTCKKCVTKNRTEKRKENNMKNYGVQYTIQRPDIREKMERTMIERYGGHCVQTEESNKKRRETNQIRYGGPGSSCNEEVQEKLKKTNMERYGVEHVFQNKDIREKSKETCIKRYGTEFPSQTEQAKEKMAKTNLEKYGCVSAMQNEEFKEKRNNTNLEKYGHVSVMQNEEIKKKFVNTILEKYGTEHPMQNDEFRNKYEQTNIERYGYAVPLLNEEIKNKCKQTMFERFGAEHAAQVPEILSKMRKSAFSHKEYILPSGNVIEYQGYEDFALDQILNIEQIYEDDIVMGEENVPEIWYLDENGKKHRHYVDIYVKSQNKCIEVKSEWTLKLGSDIIFLKQAAGKALGYEYEIWVYDRKGKRIQCYE